MIFLVPRLCAHRADTSPFTIFCRVRPTHLFRVRVRRTHSTNIILFQVLKYLCLREWARQRNERFYPSRSIARASAERDNIRLA